MEKKVKKSKKKRGDKPYYPEQLAAANELNLDPVGFLRSWTGASTWLTMLNQPVCHAHVESKFCLCSMLLKGPQSTRSCGFTKKGVFKLRLSFSSAC